MKALGYLAAAGALFFLASFLKRNEGPDLKSRVAALEISVNELERENEALKTTVDDLEGALTNRNLISRSEVRH